MAMAKKDEKLLEKLGICPIWLLDTDLNNLKSSLCYHNISSVDAENVRIVRRKLQLKKYRLESYHRKRDIVDKLIEEKRELENEMRNLLSEIERFKKEIFH